MIDCIVVKGRRMLLEAGHSQQSPLEAAVGGADGEQQLPALALVLMLTPELSDALRIRDASNLARKLMTVS